VAAKRNEEGEAGAAVATLGWMRKSGLALVALCVLATGCGDSGSQETACQLLDRNEVVAALRAAGTDATTLRSRSSESLDQSICAYRGQGTNVRLNVDSAPEVRRRYFNRVTEAAQLGGNDPGQRPRPVQGLGDDDALGPAGAYWTGDFRQLFVLRGERLFIYQLSAPGLGVDDARRAAVRLAAATLPGKPRTGPARTTDGARSLEVEVLAPRSGEAVRSARVVVRGIVTGEAVAVRVAGRPAEVRDGTFARLVPLHSGANRIRVSASAGGQVRSRTVTVRRGRSARAVGEASARRHPGIVPDVLAEPLGDAEAILDGAGMRHRVVKLADGSLRMGTWTVCRTKPIPDARARGAVMLFVDRADPFRTSGTTCAQE
jgi:glucodextranase-like protein